MTEGAADGAKPNMTPQLYHLEANPLGEARTREADASGVTHDQPIYVGYRIIWFILGKTVRAVYEKQVAMFNRDLTAYFDTCKHISERQRWLIRDQFLSSLKLMNAYQSWSTVFDSLGVAVASLVIFPLWLVCATAAVVLSWTSPPPAFKLAYLCLLLLFLSRIFISYLHDPDEQFLLKRGRLLALFVGAASGWLLFGGWSKLDPLAVCGVLLLSTIGTTIVTVAALWLMAIMDSANGSTRMSVVAVYLAGIGALAFGATSDQPDWPSWIVHGIWAALWASLSVAIVFGALYMLSFLASVSLWRWKNRRHVVAELVQTLTWLGLRLEESERPESERSELSIKIPELGLREDLEYIAGLIQRFLPGQLRTLDPCGDSSVAERCRGMAAAVRQLKLDLMLDQSTSSSEIAAQIVPAIEPIFLGAWNKIAYIAPQDQSLPSRWKRAFRVFGRIIAAVAPLGALLLLRSSGIVSNTILAQALPIVVTWLLVSILTWIDPRSESNISGVKTVTDLMHGSRSNT